MKRKYPAFTLFELLAVVWAIVCVAVAIAVVCVVVHFIGKFW